MLDKNLVYYLTGPMSGIPQANFPLFDSAARALRKVGFKIITPSEMDSPQVRAETLAGISHEHQWGSFLARDVRVIADEVGGLILLPGWQGSRGARLEVFVGILCHKEFGLYDPSVEVAIETDIIHARLWLRSTI